MKRKVPQNRFVLIKKLQKSNLNNLAQDIMKSIVHLKI